MDRQTYSRLSPDSMEPEGQRPTLVSSAQQGGNRAPGEPPQALSPACQSVLSERALLLIPKIKNPS